MLGVAGEDTGRFILDFCALEFVQKDLNGIEHGANVGRLGSRGVAGVRLHVGLLRVEVLDVDALRFENQERVVQVVLEIPVIAVGSVLSHRVILRDRVTSLLLALYTCRVCIIKRAAHIHARSVRHRRDFSQEALQGASEIQVVGDRQARHNRADYFCAVMEHCRL